MKDYEVASALNIIAEAHNSRTICIDVRNRFVSFEGPPAQEVALAIAVEDFMSSVEYIEIEPVIEAGIQTLKENHGWLL